MKTILHEGKFLRLINNDGWEYVERTNCSDIVVIFNITKDNKVIFVEQFRPPVGANVIEFPAGLVGDKGTETIATAVMRELFEETGYKADKIIKLFSGPNSSGSSANLLTFVLTPNIVKVGEALGDGHEKIIVHEVDYDNISNWIKETQETGKLISPRIYIGLYFLNKYRNGEL